MKKRRYYLIVTIVTLLIISIVFLLKGIYPFGSNTLIYSDMYEQITSYLYYFYDAVKGSQSLLIDFAYSIRAFTNFVPIPLFLLVTYNVSISIAFDLLVGTVIISLK